jgi:uncharacterized protein (TIGR02996 family)
MTEEDVFLLDILARPDDDAPRLIYADWLLDQGDPRGELVRLDWELRGSRDAGAVAEYHRRRDEACRGHGWMEYDGLVLTRERFVFAFRLRLAETIAFCAGRDLPLRSWDLDPRSLTGHLTNQEWPYSRDIDWPGMLVQLAIARRRLLEQSGKAPSRPASGLANGRLLVFDPWVTIGIGWARTYSNGYFDSHDFPPWDTWVMQVPEPSPARRADPRRVTPHYLVAWVPAAYVTWAGAGVETSEEGSLQWLHQASTPLARGLREAGVLG